MIRTRIRMVSAEGVARPPLPPRDDGSPPPVRVPPGTIGGR